MTDKRSKSRGEKTRMLTIRLTQDLRERIDAAIAGMPYHPSITEVAERGFELAIAEMIKITADIQNGRYKDAAE
ncbi:hypothetical protein GOL85_13535 [Sinorhizobium medicae]|nr:hypothetical protein [Sinorhizobium medicae]